MTSRPLVLAALAAASFVAGAGAPARASSPDAWAEFERQVRTKCLAAAEPVLEGAQARVDPFGSERFGLALVSGRERGGTARQEIVCVVEKAGGGAELGGALPQEEAVMDATDGSEAPASVPTPEPSPAR